MRWNAAALRVEPQPQLVVHREVVRLVEHRLDERRAADEGDRLADEVHDVQQLAAMNHGTQIIQMMVPSSSICAQ